MIPFAIFIKNCKLSIYANKLISIIQKVDVVLKAATDSIARDLDDTVMFGGSSVSEWMRSTSKKLQEKENSGGESKGGGEEEKKA